MLAFRMPEASERMSEARLQAENEKLRNELEAYRRRELEDLRAQLASALADVSHYKQEAKRNAQVGRQIHMEAQETIRRLREQLQAKENLENARPLNRRP